jgi:hypothetical protein
MMSGECLDQITLYIGTRTEIHSSDRQRPSFGVPAPLRAGGCRVALQNNMICITWPALAQQGDV